MKDTWISWYWPTLVVAAVTIAGVILIGVGHP